MEIQSIRHRGLRRLIEDGSPRSISRDLASRSLSIVEALTQAPDIPAFIAGTPQGWRIHRISERRGNHWSVSVSGNWRITFEERDGAIYHLNLEDYH